MTMDFVKLTKEKLDIESIYNMVLSPEYGAVSLFVGTTRNNFDGKTVIKLEYEAYEGMAVKALEKICKNVREKFNVGNIAIYHRLGEVPVQEASVVIAMSSPHRKDVLEAVPFAIDALKADVPIWKKEIYEGDQAPQWKENAESAEVMINNVNITEPVELYEEVVEDDPVENVPSDMIQINANLQEINRRINSFINRKRQQVNISNIQDFCLDRSDYNESTCARVDAVLMRRKDSKSHLKIHRVENIVGPQTQPFDACNSYDGPELRPAIANCPPGAEERLKNAEHYLGINKSSLDVFQRLKAIEDKILYLESVSPEYFDFVKQEKQGKILNPAKRTFSSTELDLKLQELEHKLLNKPGTSGL